MLCHSPRNSDLNIRGHWQINQPLVLIISILFIQPVGEPAVAHHCARVARVHVRLDEDLPSALHVLGIHHPICALRRRPRACVQGRYKMTYEVAQKC